MSRSYKKPYITDYHSPQSKMYRRIIRSVIKNELRNKIRPCILNSDFEEVFENVYIRKNSEILDNWNFEDALYSTGIQQDEKYSRK